MRCASYCTATSYRIDALVTHLKKSKSNLRLYRDIVNITLNYDNTNAEIFYFSHGCLVCWGLIEDQELKIIQQLKEFENGSFSIAPKEIFNYQLGNSTSIQSNQELITLENDNPLIKLAISHGLAQSIKLITFEDAVDRTIKETSHIPQVLALKGKTTLTRKQISKQMGKLFITRSSINLNSDFLDTPEFFWEYPTLETYYRLTANYLDIDQRVEVLNRRLDVIHELLEMLTNELQHQHSSALELIIIYLIALEIFIVFIKDIMSWV